MLANIHLNDGISLDPELAVAVEKLALKHPSWVFRNNAEAATDKPSDYGSKRWHDRSISEGSLSSSPDKKYVRHVAVLQNGLAAGQILVDRNYSHRTTQNWHYIVRSPRIDNGRKGSQITTRDAGVAARAASKNFAAPTIIEMLVKAVDEGHTGLIATLRDLERPIERAQYCPDAATMQIALYNLLKGVPFDERDLREKLLSDRYEQALANYELARCMRLVPMIGIIAFRGQYVYLTHGDPIPWSETDALKRELSTTPFEDLPPNWQDKIAVLQLMKDSELVLDIGYRHNESTFLIAATP